MKAKTSRQRKAPGMQGTHHPGCRHSGSTKRWLERKKEEHRDSIEREIQTLTDFGGGHYGRKRLARAGDRMRFLREQKQKAEKDLLATTSLKDLIK